jgi:hypothetical protein
MRSQLTCRTCGDDINPKRAEIGYRLCLPCGEDAARVERAGWTVVQQYGKGPYQLVTQGAASEVLKSTNQKEVRV